ncbi:MAG TPA: cellulase family glycosylhydrolase [Acidimicrobiales bacterium]|nr:cellulase family glycosylhydrolase [Acidimicrobiales bacterium]
MAFRTGEHPVRRRRRARDAVGVIGVAIAVVAAGIVLPAVASPGVVPQRAAGAVRTLSLRTTEPSAPSSLLSGPLADPGGTFLHDRFGRVVLLHGVNAVYKFAPYELYPDPGQPWNLSGRDASQMASLGFDVVRLGVLWAGIEPGALGPNSPQVCTPGTPHDPGQFDPVVAAAYLTRLKQTVDLLGSYGISTILDMHQDLYSSVFGGEGAPAWAVCTSGFPVVRAPGRWSNTYRTAALGAAFENFWTNDVVGDLQGEYDRVMASVAHFFRNDRHVLGYDPFNEPFSKSLLEVGHHALDAQIECFYTGAARPGLASNTGRRVACPPADPRKGLIGSVEGADPYHLVFYEPDIYSRHGTPNYVGSIDFPRLVMNFHSYCPYRNPVTGDPTDPAACASSALVTLTRRSAERALLGSRAQPRGPALFLSEFGATNDPGLLNAVTDGANRVLIGWTAWAWKYYGDPTGSSDEAIVGPDGQLQPGARALAQTYPQAVAGRPTSVVFDDETSAFAMTYVPDPRVQAPTVVFVPVAERYPDGYCPGVQGARITSRPDASHLVVANGTGDQPVTIRVTAGECRSGARRTPSFLQHSS